MATATASDDHNIDLYADSEELSQLEMKVNTEDNKPGNDHDDLFDAAILSELSGKVETENASASGHKAGSSKVDECLVTEGPGVGENVPTPAPHKFTVCVGGLTWWTTDQQLEDLLGKAGVEDLIEIKFFDNRANGQSKGYCNVYVGSERSVRIMFEKVANKELEGRKIIVATPSKATIAQFEAQAECQKPKPQGPGGSPSGCPVRGPNNGSPGIPQAYGVPPGLPRMMATPRGVRPNDAVPGLRMFPPPHHPGGPPMGPHHLHYPPQRSHSLHAYPPHPQQRPYRPYYNSTSHPNGVMYSPASPGMDHHRSPHPPRGDWSRAPGGPRLPGPFPRPPLHSPRGPLISPMQPIPLNQDEVGSPPGSQNGPPTPHVNPAFFNPNSPNYTSPIVSPEATPVRVVTFDRGRHPGGEPYTSPTHRGSEYTRSGHSRRHELTLTELEVADILSRNRAVAGSAIARAVSDASKGDFASAIETLVTAISLIRQSRVGHDERCRMLVSSLQDTLHGIENKGYGRHKLLHARSSRSRSRERSRHRSRRQYRTRSRSRDRSRERSYYSNRRSRSPGSPRGSKFDDKERSRRERDHELDIERQNENNISSKSNNGRSRKRIDDHQHEREHRSSSRR